MITCFNLVPYLERVHTLRKNSYLLGWASYLINYLILQLPTLSDFSQLPKLKSPRLKPSGGLCLLTPPNKGLLEVRSRSDYKVSLHRPDWTNYTGHCFSILLQERALEILNKVTQSQIEFETPQSQIEFECLKPSQPDRHGF